MADPKLLNYIKEALKQGSSEGQIKSTLFQQGWSSEEIENAFKEAKAFNPKKGSEEEISKSLSDLSKDIKAIKEMMVSQEARISTLEEKKVHEVPEVPLPVKEAPVPPPPSYQPPEPVPFVPSEVPPEVPPYKAGEKPGIVEEVTGWEAPEGVNLEALMGGNWLVKVGVAALVIGVGFFLKYAFDHWLLDPTVRVIIGIIIGMILIGLGEFWKDRYRLYAQALTGGGIAVLYLSIFAAYNFYELIGVCPTFFFMALVTATAGVLSVRYDAPAIAFLGIAGGFLTPFLLGVKEIGKHEKEILGYIVLLNLGILGVSLYKNWRPLSFVGFLFTYLSFGVWFADRFTPERLFFTEFALTVFFLLFAFITVVYHMASKKRAEWPDLALITMNAAIYFVWSYGILVKEYRDWLGFFAVALALSYFLLAYIAYLRNREDPHLTLFLAGISLVFLTIAIPIQLKQYWITIAWAIEGLVLSWLGIYLRSHHLRAFSLLVFMLVIVRLFGFDMMWDSRTEEFMPIFNKRFFVFFISIASFYLASYIWYLGKEDLREEERCVLPALLLSANFVTVWILSYEIIRYFDQKTMSLQKEIGELRAAPGIYPETAQDKISKLNHEIKNLRFIQNLSVSLFWTVYAMVLAMLGWVKRYAPIRTAGLVFFWIVIGKVLVFDIIGMGDLSLVQNFSLSCIWAVVGIVVVVSGIISKYAAFRVAGLSLLWVMVFKVFLFDTWKLSDLYRIGAYISLGVILLVTGYLYMRFQERIKEFLLE